MLRNSSSVFATFVLHFHRFDAVNVAIGCRMPERNGKLVVKGARSDNASWGRIKIRVNLALSIATIQILIVTEARRPNTIISHGESFPRGTFNYENNGNVKISFEALYRSRFNDQDDRKMPWTKPLRRNFLFNIKQISIKRTNLCFVSLHKISVVIHNENRSKFNEKRKF